jgi:hypothetical protein
MKVSRCFVAFGLIAGSFAAPVAEVAERQDVTGALSPLVDATKSLLSTLTPLFGSVPAASGLASCVPAIVPNTTSDATSTVASVSDVSDVTNAVDGLTPLQIGQILAALKQFLSVVNPIVGNLPTKRQDTGPVGATLGGILGPVFSQLTVVVTSLGSSLGASDSTNPLNGITGPLFKVVEAILSHLAPVLGAIPEGQELANCITSSVSAASVPDTPATSGFSLSSLLQPILDAVIGIIDELEKLLRQLGGSAPSQ